ncbi:cytoadherence linked asexual protein, putative [Plasmodium gallinaceum]|uniref:Cytoadherence linked asexual protein, putative n=1 Tax=Plasmodium gallinaceum TaxID=5849 RepID=A0A1J1GYB9_PLAGA|nr:cytoadherence linked asexual protein, putative [Plasmodium gallinaceum]CRG96000.1 cytoadherence linked asexual protein, putative [Plasmodium gallinaceum]
MVICILESIFIYVIFFLVKNICCSQNNDNMNELKKMIDNKGLHNDNMNELKKMIDNKELHDNLIKLESLIIQSLEMDDLKLPRLKADTELYLNLSNYKIIKIGSSSSKIKYIVPTSKCNVDDIVKYEHITKEHLMESYDLEKSSLVKKKNLVVRTLKIIKFMLLPIIFYKKTNKLKESLAQLNSLFYDNIGSTESTKSIFQVKYESQSSKTVGLTYKNIQKSIFIHNVLDDINIEILESNDLFFTTHPNIDFMRKLDRLSNYYDLGIFNLIGSHFIALGHFIILKLAYKLFHEYFEVGNIKFFSWEKILQFNISDRFKALDLICNHGSNYVGYKKRRDQFLKYDRMRTLEECRILEFLIHYLNKYQMELYTNVYENNLKIQVLMEHNHIKDAFFNFMCKNKSNCNIYDSEKFKTEFSKKDFAVADKYNFSLYNYFESSNISSFSIYVNFLYFIKYYNYFNYKCILYVHLLNLIGILNNDRRAYVSSLYLPGYYNAIQLSFDEKSEIVKLYENLIQCVKQCYIDERRKEILSYNIDSLLNYKKSDLDICNMCEGTLFYISGQIDNRPSMLQKFYIYLTKVIKINNISLLMKNMITYEDYDNFLANDINWYTFLLLFRLTSYKGVYHDNIAKAMYLSLKKEDKFKRSATTSYWSPSPIRKYYSLYLRKHESINLLHKLKGLLNDKIVEKIKGSIKFIIHVSSFLQLDFFSYLIESSKNAYVYPLTLLMESKFREWMKSFEMGRFFLNYENEDIEYDKPKNMGNGENETPKYRKWILIMKKFVDKSYEAYFNQKNVKKIYYYYNLYGVSNKLMLMKDSYELYSKYYEDVVFYADIFDLRKTNKSLIPRKEFRKKKFTFYSQYFFGNTINALKYGFIYGFIINKSYLKEVVDILFSIYKMNTDTFSDTSFLQTVYLLFKEIQKSFYMHRRNDNTSMNNTFFFNVNTNYSKMRKENREEEINASMASKYFAKTLFVAFQIMFTIKLSRYMDYLDRKYGNDKFLKLMIDEKAFMKYTYVFHGSMIDSLTNSFLPYYSKGPITQLRYGKAFILANMHKLCAHIFSILNLNNLSLLLEYQAIISSSFYVTKKLNQYMDKKIEFACWSFFFKVTHDFLQRMSASSAAVVDSAAKSPNVGTSHDKGGDVLEFAMEVLPNYMAGLYEIGNIHLRKKDIFSSVSLNKLQEQIIREYYFIPSKKKKKVYSITFTYFVKYFHETIFSYLLYHFFAWLFYYFFTLYVDVDLIILTIRNRIRVFDRFYSIFEDKVEHFLQQKLNNFSIDPILEKAKKAQMRIKNKEKYEDLLNSRVHMNEFNKKPYIKNIKEKLLMLTPHEIEKLLEKENIVYIDDDSSFEGLDEDEVFLNRRKTICYEEKIGTKKNENMENNKEKVTKTRLDISNEANKIRKGVKKDSTNDFNDEFNYSEFYCSEI